MNSVITLYHLDWERALLRKSNNVEKSFAAERPTNVINKKFDKDVMFGFTSLVRYECTFEMNELI